MKTTTMKSTAYINRAISCGVMRFGFPGNAGQSTRAVKAFTAHAHGILQILL